MDTSNSSNNTTQQLDDEQRANHLVLHLARLKQRGARIEEHNPLRAIVTLKDRANLVPNVVIIAGGFLLFWMTHGVLFLAAAALAAFGWHRKLDAAQIIRRVLVRVDEHGKVREVELARGRRTRQRATT